MAKSCSTHVFGSVSGYTTLAKSSDISQEEDSALSGLGFGQTNNSNFIDGLFTTPTAYGRRLPSGRYAITRCFPGSPDVAGRITLLLASVIMDLDTWLNHIRGGLVKFLNDQSVWDLEKFSTEKQIKVGSFGGQLPTEASDYYLGDYLVSIHNSSQNIVVVLPERSNTTDVICHLAGALAPEDAAEFRWGIRLLSTTSPVDVMTMVGAPSTAGRRKVIKCDVQHEFRNKGAEYYAQKCPSIPALPPIAALASTTIVHERPTSKTIQFNYKPNKIILAIITIVFLLVAFFAISSSDPTGACCIGTNCIVKTEENCNSSGGTYQSDDTNCESDPCATPDPTGACCVEKECLIDTEENCNSGGGTYQSDDTNCESDPCVPTGACCVEKECSIDTEENCNSSGGTYQSDDTNCNGDPCATPDPTGACCVEKECLIDTEENCNSGGGTYQSDDTNCESDPCVPTGACCVEKECSIDTEENCNSSGGTYQSDDTNCESDPCATPDPTGACCVEKECLIDTEENCNSGGGTYQSDDTNCESDPCVPTGACCVEKECSIDTEENCNSSGGTYQSDDTNCESDPCVPTGACCVEKECSIDTEENCNSGGGTYQSDDTNCESDPCVPTGACCVEKECSIDTEENCNSSGGTYQSDDTNCESDPCVPTGACCIGESCFPKTESDCADNYGKYKGDKSTCKDDLCVITDDLFKKIQPLHRKYVTENTLGKNAENNRDVLKQFKEAANQYINHFINNDIKSVTLRSVGTRNGNFFKKVIKKDILGRRSSLLKDLVQIRERYYEVFESREDGGDRLADVYSIINMLQKLQSVAKDAVILEEYVDYLAELKEKSKKIPSPDKQKEFRDELKKWRKGLLDEGIQLEKIERDIYFEFRIPEIIASPNLDKRLNEIIKRLNDTKIDWEE